MFGNVQELFTGSLQDPSLYRFWLPSLTGVAKGAANHRAVRPQLLGSQPIRWPSGPQARSSPCHSPRYSLCYSLMSNHQFIPFITVNNMSNSIKHAILLQIHILSQFKVKTGNKD